jgi:predicted RND superfamily exporter protein
MCLFIVWRVIREKREAVTRSRITIKRAILNLTVVSSAVFIITFVAFRDMKNSVLAALVIA